MNELRIAEPTQDPGVIALLEELLTQARHGRLLAIAGVCVMVGGEDSRFMSPSIADRPIRALGMLRVLQMRVEQFVELGAPEKYFDADS